MLDLEDKNKFYCYVQHKPDGTPFFFLTKKGKAPPNKGKKNKNPSPMLGRPKSLEHRQNLSKAITGRTYKRNMINFISPMKGKKHSTESLLKMSMALQGRIPWNKGKKMGPKPLEVILRASETLAAKKQLKLSSQF